MKLIFFILTINISFASVPHIKVRLAENQRFIKISGEKLTNSITISGNKKKYKNQKTIIFDCQKTRSFAQNGTLKIAEVSSEQSILSWKKKNFFGNFVIVGNQFNNSCDLVQRVDMESYVSSVVAKEMRSDWPLEALKAQAVAARSYALHHIRILEKELNKKKFHLENSESHQVAGSLEDQSQLTHQSATETFGEILINKNGKKVPVFFHSKCGGKTLLPEDVWANSVAGYETVSCPFCHKHGKKPWKTYFKKSSLGRYMKKILNRYYPNNKKLKKRLALKQDDRDKKNISFSNLKYMFLRKSDLRKKIGREKLPSNLFSVQKKGNGYLVRGKGYGHGVGMCQFGAFELAKRGYSYTQILKHYFPNFSLKRVY